MDRPIASSGDRFQHYVGSPDSLTGRFTYETIATWSVSHIASGWRYV